jgi:exosome complex component CSL4
MTQEPPVLRFTEGSTVVPGDRLGTIRQVRSGIGTYVKGGHIYACLLGRLALQRQAAENSENENENEMDTEVDDDDEDSSNNNAEKENPNYVCCIRSSKPPATSQVLKVGQRVVGKISRITPQNAVVEIRVAEGVGPIRLPYYEGAIRLEDIRSFSSSGNSSNNNNNNNEESVAVLEDCFRPGDLVACRIISMGDSRRYFLTTAETELGVIRAERKGIPMIPVSWKEMECPETGVREPRKCAKPLVVNHRE